MAGKKIFLLAGESSGDRLGAGLMQALVRQHGAQQFHGVGGAAMQAQGLRSVFPMQEIALMGLRQIVPRLPHLLSRLRTLSDEIVRRAPDIVVLIDSPDFTHRLAARVHRRAPQIPIVVYVAPSVWAWRPGRAGAMARWCRLVLALLPFEPAAMRALGGPACVHVGHPACARAPSAALGKAWRTRHGLSADAPLLLLLPGSRRNEIASLMPVFGAAAARCCAALPQLRLVLAGHAALRDEIARALTGWSVQPQLVWSEEEKAGAFAAGTAALAASGTVVLELALAGVPAAAAYQGDMVLSWIVQRFVRAPSALLPNLILDAPVLPEFLGARCRADLLADAALSMLQEPARRQALRRALAQVKQHLVVEEAFPQALAASYVWDQAS